MWGFKTFRNDIFLGALLTLIDRKRRFSLPQDLKIPFSPLAPLRMKINIKNLDQLKDISRLWQDASFQVKTVHCQLQLQCKPLLTGQKLKVIQHQINEQFLRGVASYACKAKKKWNNLKKKILSQQVNKF